MKNTHRTLGIKVAKLNVNGKPNSMVIGLAFIG
jgi:hypothetical protein